MAEKKISGCFTDAYVLNPFNNHPIPVWISEYVLAGLVGFADFRRCHWTAGIKVADTRVGADGPAHRAIISFHFFFVFFSFSVSVFLMFSFSFRLFWKKYNWRKFKLKFIQIRNLFKFKFCLNVNFVQI